jgi:DNA-binding CsgD family transcriptional regulator
MRKAQTEQNTRTPVNGGLGRLPLCRTPDAVQVATIGVMPRETSPQKLPQRQKSSTTSRSSERESNAPKWRADVVDIVAREHNLTDRERDILLGIAAGLTTKEMAARMNVSPNTVKSFIRLVMVKTLVSSRTELLAKLLDHHAEQSGVRAPEADRYRTAPLASPHMMLDFLVDRAIEVIGDRDEAMRWLGTPIRALDYATPISLLGTNEGASRVEDVLGQMEHGVW